LSRAGSTGNAVDAAITWRHDWAPHLFSFRVDRPAGLRFAPGQFVRLGVSTEAGGTEWRAYSIASPPTDDMLEFYSIVVPDGAFTQALVRLGVGDSIAIDGTVYGFLRTDRFAPASQLWLLATGTGIAPFASILGDDAVWSAYDDLVVVHSVRTAAELAYRDAIEARGRRSPHARLHYVPTITGTDAGSGWHARIPALLADRRLEDALGLAITPDSSRLMVCGNPAMIKEARAVLVERGLAPVRRDRPGQFIVENFW